jgi:hypothetical protein
MAEKSDSSGGKAQGVGNGHDKERRVQVGIRLASGEPSTQPILCNFSGVTNAGGLLLLEFGFLEPGGLNAVAKAARSGANPPDAITGQRICRLALPPDTAAQLAQQLKGLLGNAAKVRVKQQQKAASA